MKVTILREDLNKGLAIVSRVIAGKGQLPVLANVLLEAKRDGLVLTGTNLDLGMRVGLGGKIEEEGTLTIPARTLAELVGSMGGESVRLVSDGDKLKVSGNKLVATLVGIPATEFPVIPSLAQNKEKKIRLSRKVIGEIAAQVAYAASGDESRPVLTGVKLSVVGEQLVVTATDGFRMARKTIESGQIKMDAGGLILPARSIIELAKLSEGGKSEIEMTWLSENNQVIFGLEEVELVSRVLQGNFPDTEKIVPQEFKTVIIVDREEFLKNLRSAGIFARDSSNIVRLKIEDEKLVMRASAGSVGENESEIEVDKEGEDVEIAFNYKYLLDFLGSVTNERVVLKLNDAMAAGVFGVEKDESVVSLVMPVRI